MAGWYAVRGAKGKDGRLAIKAKAINAGTAIEAVAAALADLVAAIRADRGLGEFAVRFAIAQIDLFNLVHDLGFGNSFLI